MTLQDLGNIGEFLAAVGVIVSLIYLAFQIRQNTSSVRTSMIHDSASRAADLTITIAEHKELAHIMRTGMGGLEHLEDDDDRFRFIMLLSSIFRQYDDQFFQYRAGTITSESWDAWRYSLRGQLSNPGFPPFWDVRRLAFTESFRQFVDAECETAEPFPTVAEISEKLKRTT